MQEQAGCEDVLEPERVEPLQLGEEPDDRAGEEEDQQRQAEESDADPESSRRPREPDLSGFERSAALERIKRPVPAGCLTRSLDRTESEVVRAEIRVLVSGWMVEMPADGGAQRLSRISGGPAEQRSGALRAGADVLRHRTGRLEVLRQDLVGHPHQLGIRACSLEDHST